MRRYGVIGLGQFGRQLALSLTQLGAEVLGLDQDEKAVDSMRDLISQVICLDTTDEAALLATGITDLDAVIVAIGENLASSVLTTALLVKLGVRYIVARSSSELQTRILKAIGAHTVVDPEKGFAIKLANDLESREVKSVALLETGHRIVELEAHRSLWGKTLQELRFRDRYHLNVIAVRRRTPVVGPRGEIEIREEVNDLPAGSDRVEKGDILVVLGREESIARFQEEEE